MTTIFSRMGILCLSVTSLLFQSCNDDQKILTPNEGKESLAFQKHLIDGQTLQILKNEYIANDYATLSASRISKGLSKEEARQVIYPIEVLQGYINYIKNQTENQDPDNIFLSISLGQYPQDKLIDNRQNAAYRGYQTVFLTPYSSIDGSNLSKIENSSELNHGQTIPPADDTGDDGQDKDFNNYLITKSQSDILQSTFIDNNYKILNETRVGKSSNTEKQIHFFYNVNILDGYLKYIKSEAKIKGIENVLIVINIGQIPKDKTIITQQENFEGDQCVYFTAAASLKSVANNDFNLFKGLLEMHIK